MPISLPVLKTFQIDNYLLYPGTADQSGLRHDFGSGVTLIVGTNGLGKTTLINALFRCVVGPNDPPKNADVVLSSKQTETLWRDRKTYFRRRVGDQAQAAVATLSFDIGSTLFEVSRALSDLRLVSLKIGGVEIQVDRDGASAEAKFKRAFQEAVGASSYVAALQIVRQLVFFDEDRRALLWDTQRQSAMLRDLLIGAEAAGKLRDVQSKFLSADSGERNIRWQVNRLSNLVREATSAQSSAEPIGDRLQVIVQQLRADEDRRSSLEQQIDDTEQEVRRLQLEAARSRLIVADLRDHVEERRLRQIEGLFPDITAVGEYTLTRFFSDHECRVCGADVAEKLGEIQANIAKRFCVICDSPPEKQRKVPPVSSPDSAAANAAYEAAQTELEHAELQLRAMTDALEDAEKGLRAQTIELGDVVRSIGSARTEAESLEARLPPDDERVRQYRSEHEAMTMLLRKTAQQRRDYAEELRGMLSAVKEAASAKQSEIVEAFGRYAQEFLAEDATLSYAPREQQLGQSGDKFDLPRFRLDMTSAAYEGRVARDGAEDVSESQREFIDLAYRMALIDVCVDGSACLIMETPEASLDGVFMEQAGKMLNTYGSRDDRQLVVTSNLSSAGMIKALMKGAANPYERLINLFEIAAPTRAVELHHARYEELLTECLGQKAASE